MTTFEKIKILITKPSVFFRNAYLKALMFIPSDKLFLKIKFKDKMGYSLNLNKPVSFNEKLNWIKLYDRNPLYTLLVDKVKVKEYVANIIGEDHVIPTIGVWNNAKDIDFDQLPSKFVIKCNHDSGGLCVCKDKSHLDIKKVRADLAKSLATDYYKTSREWPYKNVPRRILAEKLMEDPAQPSLIDYKVMCFGGEPKMIQVHQGRFSENYTQDFYDVEWHKLDISQPGEPNSDQEVKKPVQFDEMMRFSAMLSKDLPQARVDWYIINDHLYFGEITLFDASGFLEFHPESWDIIMGSWINLPE